MLLSFLVTHVLRKATIQIKFFFKKGGFSDKSTPKPEHQPKTVCSIFHQFSFSLLFFMHVIDNFIEKYLKQNVYHKTEEQKMLGSG